MLNRTKIMRWLQEVAHSSRHLTTVSVAEWDTSPSQVTPQHFVRLPLEQYPFIHLGGETHYESEVPCPRTQRSDPGRART